MGMMFNNLDLKEYIVRALQDLKFKELTPIQLEVFSKYKTNKNILAKSKTGSGKTHSFLHTIFQE